MLTTGSASFASRLQFSERAELLRLGDDEPGVRAYAWRTGVPRAAVVLIHGMQSHAQWFADAAEVLVDRGLTVYALDRRGSGSSPAVRGDVQRYTDWYDEVATLVSQARLEYPTCPVHLVGHCFGANIALGSALRRRLDVASIVMLTPGLYVRPDYTAWEKLRIALAALMAPQARFRVPQDDDLFSRDPDVLAWIRADTLGARTVTARCLFQTRNMLKDLRRGLGELPVPVLVLEATRDRLSHNQRNRVLLDRVLGERCRWESFDAEHFLLAEPCCEQVIDAIVRWATQAEQQEAPC
jgi:alpha-beta hydrolase superfamily lysophospholipase